VNRCTQHHVLNDFEGERVIQRVTVMTDETRRSSNSSRTAKPSLRPFETAPAAETAGGQTTIKE
ncbi:MAG: hypothetical protein OSB70_19770, partial [Myxococcota bacterium]|nr:hypothetical protein [Myxococcota bacterium]